MTTLPSPSPKIAQQTGSSAPSGRVHPLVRRLRRLQEKAAKNAIPWATKKPTKRGVWYGAKWQFAGYYHIGCYPNGSVKYLRAQNNEYWSGPYESREDWMRYMPPPNDQDQQLTPHKTL